MMHHKVIRLKKVQFRTLSRTYGAGATVTLKDFYRRRTWLERLLRLPPKLQEVVIVRFIAPLNAIEVSWQD